jgi:hypothetical protein
MNINTEQPASAGQLLLSADLKENLLVGGRRKPAILSDFLL